MVVSMTRIRLLDGSGKYRHVPTSDVRLRERAFLRTRGMSSVLLVIGRFHSCHPCARDGGPGSTKRGDEGSLRSGTLESEVCGRVQKTGGSEWLSREGVCEERYWTEETKVGGRRVYSDLRRGLSGPG